MPARGPARSSQQTALRRQRVRIVDGNLEGGYAGVYDLICPAAAILPTWMTPRWRRGFSGFAGRTHPGGT